MGTNLTKTDLENYIQVKIFNLTLPLWFLLKLKNENTEHQIKINYNSILFKIDKTVTIITGDKINKTDKYKNV